MFSLWSYTFGRIFARCLHYNYTYKLTLQMIAKLLRQSHLYLLRNIGQTFYECNFYLTPNKRPFFCPLYIPKRPVMPFWDKLTPCRSKTTKPLQTQRLQGLFLVLPVGILRRSSPKESFVTFGRTGIYPDYSGTNGLRVLCHPFITNGYRELMTHSDHFLSRFVSV